MDGENLFDTFLIYFFKKNFMNILDFISNFRSKFWDKFFLNGGCYIFARILQKKFWGSIYSNINHVVLKKSWILYDITWIVKNDGKYSIIDPIEELRYRDFENFNH